jgi:NADH:ubiquinone oxidoreductase subunit 4 (subunit M)
VANTHLLSVLIWLPVIGGALILALGEARASAARWASMAVAVVTFLWSLRLLTGFDYANPGMQFVEQHAWIPAYGIHYNLGVDGIAVALILLTTLVGVLALAGAWGVVNKRVHQYVASFLMLQGVTVGIFAATDAILFYVFFEAMLIPMFLIIGVWGGPRRIYAAMKFFLYTFLGSVLMLVALIYLYLKGGSFQLADLYALPLTSKEQTWIFFAFMIAFALVREQGSTDMALLGMQGAMVQMISHGFVSGAMFTCIGVMYDRLHTRQIKDYGGVINAMPWFGFFYVLFAMANCGLPGTSGFVGEFMVILASFAASPWIALFAAFTLIIGAAYTLWLVKRVLWGEVTNPHVAEMKEINGRETFVLVAFAAAVLALGIWPQPLVHLMDSSVAQLVQQLAIHKI